MSAGRGSGPGEDTSYSGYSGAVGAGTSGYSGKSGFSGASGAPSPGGITNSAPSGTVPKSIDGSGNLESSHALDDGTIFHIGLGAIGSDPTANSFIEVGDFNTSDPAILITGGDGGTVSLRGNVTVNGSPVSSVASDVSTDTIAKGSGAGNLTDSIITESDGTVTVSGNLNAADMVVNSIVASNSNIARIVGSANAPFASVYLGLAATNNIQLAGTATGPRVATFPDFSGTVGMQAIVTNSSPTTGQTVSASTGKLDETLYITPAGTLLALTVSLPTSANSRVGEIIRGFISQIITTLTVNVSGSGTIVGATPVTSAVNSTFAYQCVSVAGNGTWIRIQ